MARRKQKNLIDPGTALRLLMTVGAIWLVGQLLLSRGFIEAVGLAILLGGALTIVFVSARHLSHADAGHTLFQKAQAVVEQQLNALIRRRAQLVQPDAYGKLQLEKWQKEKDGFITQQIAPLLTPNESRALERERKRVADLIEARVATATQNHPAFQEFSNDMTPIEFEVFCAEALRRAGWNASVTAQSRDQGTDVIAEKDGVRVVIQCKLYTRPVGNKSVQEAAAAKAHEQASYGVVVTNNSYTTAAKQLASTNGILLLHYSDLQNLHNLLAKSGHIARS